MKDRVLLQLYRRRLSFRNLHSWAELFHYDEFFPDPLTQCGEYVKDFLSNGYIEDFEYEDDMYGHKNVKWWGYKVTPLGESYLKERNLL
ncbi:hypothetical protein [Dyadobacter sp. 22481]|uniref:hypothetical protein n=1 Tax=Dyadobacter sp. 22481 TaxID=3453926 RepID=UPI003F876CC4